MKEGQFVTECGGSSGQRKKREYGGPYSFPTYAKRLHGEPAQRICRTEKFMVHSSAGWQLTALPGLNK